MQTQALVAVGMALALAGCQTTGAPLSTESTAKIDAKIATVSQQLAQYCTAVSLGITVGEAFSHNAKVDQALGYGRIAVARFCSAPPSDTKTAIASLAAIAIDISNAIEAAKAPPATGA